MRWSSFVAAAAAIVCGGLLSITFVDKSTADGYRYHRHHHHHYTEHYKYVRPVQIVRVPMCMPNDLPSNRPLACNPPVAPAYVHQHGHTRYLATEVRYQFVAPHYHAIKVREAIIRHHHHDSYGEADYE